MLGYATVGGTRVALSLKRSTRGEGVERRGLFALNTGAVTSAASFVSTAVSVEGMFNFFYVDDRDIAHATAGRLPTRSPGTDPGARSARESTSGAASSARRRIRRR